MDSKKLPLCYWMTLAVIIIQDLTSAENCRPSQSGLAYFPYPGAGAKSCEDIYYKYPEYHDNPGYYWVTNYCGMGYSGLCWEDIYNNYPEIRDKPGYYRVKSDWVFCNMTAISNYVKNWQSTCAGVGGGWTRIIRFNSNAGDACPSGWTNDTQSGVRFCRPPGNNPTAGLCYSTRISTSGMTYTSVCGRARGYQKGDVWGFWGSTTTKGKTIEGSYVDGLSITHGTGPRHHIWTYAVGHYDDPAVSYGCPCSPYKANAPPSYINDNYYCESGAAKDPAKGTYHFSDPLWDGSGCSKNNSCCSNKQQPWFYHNLGITTTDDIEARICISHDTYASGAVVVDQLELYIQ